MIDTPGRALVVVPHPDDAEAWCGGTVAKWVRDGSEVDYVLCTDGAKGSNDPEMTSERLSRIREKEQLEAASALGVKEVVMLRHLDGELEDTDGFRKEIVRAIRRCRPDTLLCPDPYKRAFNWHRDHRIAGQVAVDAAFPYARDHLHYRELLSDEGLETHKTGTILFWAPDVADTFVDISETIDLKIAALLRHGSQLWNRAEGSVGESVRKRAIQAAEGSGYEYAEAFRKIEFRR